MRIRIPFALLMVLAGTIPAARAQVRLTWPDPVERAAIERQELAREFRLQSARRAPADARTRLQDRYDVKYYRLDLDLRNPAAEWILGTLDATLRVSDAPLDTLLFDLHDNMIVDSVLVDGRRAEFTLGGFDLTILPPEPVPAGSLVQARVFYQGHPVETGEVAFTFGNRNGVPTIWTLSEPVGAREWWPCKDRPDDKADSVDVIVRVPQQLVVTSNGILASNVLEDDQTRTFHWKHRYPISTYLVCVNASDYVRLDDRYVSAGGDTLPIMNFVYPEQVDAGREDFSITPQAIGLYEELFGPYPFRREKYGHTIFPWPGGMEHQTNTSYGTALVRGDHRYDYVLVHELSHQWWGDMTSPADWRDVWLNEGFASYAEALWAEHLGGADALQRYMTQIQFVAEPSGRVYDPLNLFDPNVVYNKGAWVLHMLRGIVGDSLFFATFDEYRARTAYRSTTTAEFRAITEQVCRQDLAYFFEPWLYEEGRPSYAVSFLSVGEPDLPRVAVHIAQTQKDLPYFTMPVDLKINMEGGGSFDARVVNDPDHEDFEIDVPAVPTSVVIDPENWILKFATPSPYKLNITTTDLPAAEVGDSVRVTLQGRGGEPPYIWSAQAPPGIAIDPATGVLSGTAPDSGLYIFYVSLADHAGGSDTQRYRWKIGAQPADTTVIPPPRLSLKVAPSPARLHVEFAVEGPFDAHVSLEIYDLRGREVRKLWDGAVPARTIPWNGLDARGHPVASGIYLCRLSGPGGAVTRRLVWIR